MSKAHGGMSQDYAKKQAVRQAREDQREALKLAKEIYDIEFGHPEDGRYLRAQLNKIKMEIVDE